MYRVSVSTLAYTEWSHDNLEVYHHSITGPLRDSGEGVGFFCLLCSVCFQAWLFWYGFNTPVCWYISNLLWYLYRGIPFFTLKNKLVINICLLGGAGLVVLTMYTRIYRVNLLLCLYSKWSHMLLVKWSPLGQGTAWKLLFYTMLSNLEQDTAWSIQLCMSVLLVKICRSQGN